MRFLAARSLESELTREGFAYEAFEQAYRSVPPARLAGMRRGNRGIDDP